MLAACRVYGLWRAGAVEIRTPSSRGNACGGLFDLRRREATRVYGPPRSKRGGPRRFGAGRAL